MPEDSAFERWQVNGHVSQRFFLVFPPVDCLFGGICWYGMAMVKSQVLEDFCWVVTLPKTNIAPESRLSQKETIVFQPSIFRCERLLVSGSRVDGLISDLVRFLWRTWVNAWSWKGLSQVLPCTTCSLDPKVCVLHGFWDGSDGNPTSFGKKTMEGFPSLPNTCSGWSFG